jgi:hypothetical protein
MNPSTAILNPQLAIGLDQTLGDWESALES